MTPAGGGSDGEVELWYVILLCTEVWSYEDVVVTGLVLWEEQLRLADEMAGVGLGGSCIGVDTGKEVFEGSVTSLGYETSLGAWLVFS